VSLFEIHGVHDMCRPSSTRRLGHPSACAQGRQAPAAERAWPVSAAAQARTPFSPSAFSLRSSTFSRACALAAGHTWSRPR